MDIRSSFATPAIEPSAAAIHRAVGSNERILKVTATYRLSEEGRKASLLAGGDGRAIQQITIDVPSSRLHLVTVDAQGRARLKLRPRFELDGERVVRHDSPPIHDSTPTAEDLLRAAARNHQLERDHHTQRNTAHAENQAAQRELRIQLAQAFLSDPSRRALVHPAPSSKRCYLETEHGRLLFDVVKDEGRAREVPPEAHRRFRADLRARRERGHHERAAQLAVHEEKKRFIAEWIADHGTAEQQLRQAAGLLPMEEALDAMTDLVFAPLAKWPRYPLDGVARVQDHLRQFSRYSHINVVADDLVIESKNAVTATAAQFALIQNLQAVMPNANVRLRVHRLSTKTAPEGPTLTTYGVLITNKFGPFTLRREYAAPPD